MLNPASVSSVPAKYISAPLRPAPGCPAGAKEPEMTNFSVSPPLVEFNKCKRKADDEDGNAILKTIAPFWGVLHVDTLEEASMKIVASLMDDNGFTGLGVRKIKRGHAGKVEMTYLQNSKPIRADEILMLPPID